MVLAENREFQLMLSHLNLSGNSELGVVFSDTLTARSLAQTNRKSGLQSRDGTKNLKSRIHKVEADIMTEILMSYPEPKLPQ